MMKPLKESSVKTRRQYDETFKREAVQNWINSGKSAAVVAEELGLTAERLYAWRRGRAPADAGGRAAAGARPGSPTDLQSQLDAEPRESRHIREQCAILKNAFGTLFEASPNASLAYRRLRPSIPS